MHCSVASGRNVCVLEKGLSLVSLSIGSYPMEAQVYSR